MVQLKELLSIEIMEILLNFNSSMVQLKEEIETKEDSLFENFNSSMVQLKADTRSILLQSS